MNVEMIEPPVATEIAEYSQTEAALNDLRERMANVEYDVTTTKGMDIAKKDRAEVRGLRTGLEAMRKQIKAPALAHCKLIDAEAARITTELLKLEEPIDQQIKAREVALEAEKAAKEAAERARILAISGRIAHIKGFHALALECRTADRIQILLDKMVAEWLAFDFEDDFAEFGDEAQNAYNRTHERMTALVGQKKDEEIERAAVKASQEAEAAKIKAERAKLAAEQETARLAAKAEDDRRQAEYARWAREQQDAREALEAQAAKIAADTATLEAARAAMESAQRQAQEDADRAAYADAIAVETVMPVIDAAMKQIFGEAGDAEPVPAVVAEQPPTPTAHELIWAVARAFQVHSGQAAEWMTDRADEIANFE